MLRMRWALVALAAAALVTIAGVLGVPFPTALSQPSVARPLAQPADVSIAQESACVSNALSMPGVSATSTAAISALGSQLPAVARRYGMTPEVLEQTLLSDSTLNVDRRGALFYVEPAPEVDAPPSISEMDSAVQRDAAAAPFPLSQTFMLHSRPGAERTILLDFKGMRMSGNAWTASYNGGADIVCPPFSLDGSPSFSEAEQAIIQEVWQRVAEDYAPFDIDVTTEFTSEEVITRSSSADRIYGTRALISPISDKIPDAAGIAYVGAFNDIGDYYKPALVFPESWGNTAKDIAQTTSHECGHNLALLHDGTSAIEYYPGGNGWAPIMGQGHYESLTQWSKGEYSGANNFQDDLALIAAMSGFRADDAAGSRENAAELQVGSSISAAGVITDAGDADYYRFVAGAGPAAISIVPAPSGPNLDIAAELLDANGAVVASSDSASTLSARISVPISQGVYYIRVRGTGKGDPLTTGGYSNYASVGQYTLSGSVPAIPPPTTTLTAVPSAALSGWVSGDVTITLTAVSSMDPVARTSYTVDGSAEQDYASPFRVTGDGAVPVTYHSFSNLGIAETVRTATVYLDNSSPVTGPTNMRAMYRVSSGATIALAANDPQSGVASTRWRLGSASTFTSGAAVPVPSQAGTYTVQYYSVDKVGNVEPTKSLSFAVVNDSTPPRTTSDAAATYDTSARVTLVATDTGIGVESTHWLLDGAAGTGTTVDVLDYGSHELRFWSVDAAGNAETPTTVTLFVRDVNSPTVCASADYAWLNGMSVEFQAADESHGSGLDVIAYRLDGAETQTIAASNYVLTPRRPGRHECVYWAVDKAGNASALATLVFDVIAPTRFVMDAIPAPVKPGVETTISGRVDTESVTAPLLGEPVVLQVLRDSAWTKALPSPALAQADGAFAFRVAPYESGVYRVIVGTGSALRAGESETFVIGAKASVTRPSKPNSPRHRRAFTLTGWVMPSLSRSVQVKYYRVKSGKRTLYSTKTASLSSAGKWTYRRSLPRGSWAVRVVYTDPLKVVSTSSYRSFTVK